MAHNRAFGQWFRELTSGESQSAVAEKLDISQAYVSRLRNGTVPGLEILERISAAYARPVSEARQFIAPREREAEDEREEIAQRAVDRALERIERVAAGRAAELARLTPGTPEQHLLGLLEEFYEGLDDRAAELLLMRTMRRTLGRDFTPEQATAAKQFVWACTQLLRAVRGGVQEGHPAPAEEQAEEEREP